MRPTSVLRSSTLRQALIYIGLFSAGVFVLFGYVYWSTAAFVRADTNRAIAAEFALLSEAYDRGGRDAVIAAMGRHVAARPLEQGAYLLAESSFNTIAGNLDEWPRSLRDGRGFADFAVPRTAAGPAGLRIRARYDTLPQGYRLLVGRGIDHVDQFVGTIQLAFAVAVGLMFGLAAVASLTVTRRTVGRIEAINATSREIMRSGLSSRIPLRGTRDEWDQLAENLNSMLDRIEELMQEIRQVSDNVAHDLRTPLTRLRGRLERASRRPLDGDQCQTLVSDALTELDGVLGLFSSILRIAQLEAREGCAAFQRIDLTELAGQIAELFDAVAEEKGGHVSLVGVQCVYVLGDRDLLFDAISNLVDNAVKHGGANGRVMIEVILGALGPTVVVTDDGPGIPPDAHKRVLKRFCRLEHSRSTPGNGLGLSLVAAVAQLHGAQIEMASNAPGLRIALRFPPTRIGLPIGPKRASE